MMNVFFALVLSTGLYAKIKNKHSCFFALSVMYGSDC